MCRVVCLARMLAQCKALGEYKYVHTRVHTKTQVRKPGPIILVEEKTLFPKHHASVNEIICE